MSLVLKDLWIGDSVRIKSSGRIGKYEGIHANGKARISSHGKVYLASSNNLELYEEVVQDEPLSFEDEDIAPSTDMHSVIDLHIETLNPNLSNALPERIYDYQMKAFLEYLDKAHHSYKNEFTIIHGIGTGVLKQSVMNYLKTDKRVRLYETINNGGAVRIIL